MKKREILPIIYDPDELEELVIQRDRAKLRARADEILRDAKRREREIKQLQILLAYDPAQVDA